MTKKPYIYFALAALILTSCSVNENSKNPDSYVEVVCRAEKEVDPDTFHLSINLQESAKGNISAMEAKMLQAFTAIGIDVKADLSMTGMSGDNWYWWRKSRNVTQNKSYLLKAKDTDLLSKVCDELDKMGYANYYLSKVDFSGIDSLKQEVQQAAVRQSRIKANTLLAGDGKKAGDLIYLQESRANGYGSIYERNVALYDNLAMKEVAAESPSFQKIKVYYEVIARFSID